MVTSGVGLAFIVANPLATIIVSSTIGGILLLSGLIIIGVGAAIPGRSTSGKARRKPSRIRFRPTYK